MGEKSKVELIDSYINAGSKAVRECAPEALIALHLDTLYTGTYKKIMDVWERDDVDYDVLGASSYAFWAGDNMVNSLKRQASTLPLEVNYLQC